MKQAHSPRAADPRRAPSTLAAVDGSAPSPAHAYELDRARRMVSERSIDELVGALTLEEKVSLLAGMDLWRLPAIEQFGIPGLVMSDGPSGVRGESFITSRSACFPCGTALAATWDPDLVGLVGDALGREARAAGVDVLLGPTVNLHRHPLAGRNFECFSEDPELTAQLARAYIEGVQAHGVACCIKHLVANDSEFERHTISSEVDEDVLRELYLAPFEEAVAAGVWSVMASYNKLGGTHTSEHPWLLTEVLREEWGFDGVVVSDWFATHSTTHALTAGLDIEMPGPARYRLQKLVEAVQGGAVPTEAVDRAARRVLRLIGRTAGLDSKRPQLLVADADHKVRALIRTAGARSMVLLHNDGVLPLRPEELRTVALIGPGADRGEFTGGGSAVVNPTHLAGILPALSQALAPAARVRFERGCVLPEWPVTLSAPLLSSDTECPGLTIEYLRRSAPAQPPLLTQTAPALRGIWIGQVVPGVANDEILIRARGVVRSPESGVHTLSVAGTGKIRALVDGQLVLEHEASAKGDTGFDLRAHAERAPVALTAGVATEVLVEFEPATGKGLIAFDVGLVSPDPPELMDRAVALARDADVAVVVVGSPPGWESEGRDRPSMTLPGRQDELVARVAAANPRTVVVANAGSPCEMPWVDRVAAVVQMWFPGQELGGSLADVLTGVVNPSGKLPTTFPRRQSDAASAAFYPGGEGKVRYSERLGVGYRRLPGEERPAPLFVFGHGLSYSRFNFGPAEVSVSGEGAEVCYELSVPVTNSSGPAGREVLQAYVSSGQPGRPVVELKGFAGVELAPGETKTAVISIPQRKLRAWSDRGWRLLAGPLSVRIGPSSDCLPMEVQLPDLSELDRPTTTATQTT